MNTECPHCGAELRLRVVMTMKWDAVQTMFYGIWSDGRLALQYGGYTETETAHKEYHTQECLACGWMRAVTDAEPIERLLEKQDG